MDKSRREFLRNSCSFGFVASSPFVRVWANEANANIVETNNANVPSLRIATISDLHYGQENTNYEWSTERAVEALRQESPLDAVIINGDLVHDKPELISKVKMEFESLECPVYATYGNHDRMAARDWRKLWGYNVNDHFKIKNTGVILATTSDEEGDYLPVDLAFLEKAVRALNSSCDHILVFAHISQKKWVRFGVDAPEVMDFFNQQRKIRAVFHGHDHDHDSVLLDGDKPYFFSGHCGGSWGVNYHGYRIIEMYQERFFRTYQFNFELNPVINDHHITF